MKEPENFLCLTRRLDQSIWIGDDILIKVSKIGSGEVRLAISAPRSIRIDRGEIREKPDYNKGFQKNIGEMK